MFLLKHLFNYENSQQQPQQPNIHHAISWFFFSFFEFVVFSIRVYGFFKLLLIF